MTDAQSSARPACPVCQGPLEPRNDAPDAWLFCRAAHGLALFESALRAHLATHDKVVSVLFERAEDSDELGNRGCPRCRLPMTLVAITADRHALALDACTGCRLVWFDPAELRRLEIVAERDGDHVSVFASLAKSVLKAFGVAEGGE